MPKDNTIRKCKESTIKNVLGFISIIFFLLSCGSESSRDKVDIKGVDEARNKLGLSTRPIDISVNSDKILNGDNFELTIEFNKNVIVSGSPSISFNVGGVNRILSYVSGSGNEQLVFSYVTLVADQDLDGVVINNSIDLNAGSINDESGNSALLSIDSSLLSSLPLIFMNNEIELSNVANQSILEESPLTGVVFSYGSAIDCTTEVSAVSNNQALVQNSNITFLNDSAGVCEINIAPETDAVGVVQISILADDGTITGSTSLQLTITNVNDLPVIGSNQSETVDDNTNLSITLNPSTDVDSGDTLTYSLVTAPINGVLANCMGLNASLATDRVCDYIAPVNFEGVVNFIYRANDGIANTAADATVTITVSDKTPPALSFSTPSANTTGQSSIDLVMACENDSALTFGGSGLDSGFTAGSNCSGGSYSQTVNFSASDGVKNITVTQTDVNGNTTTVNRDFVRDNVAPSITSVLIADGVINVGTNFVIVKVQANDNADIESIRLANSNGVTDECQSEYSDTNWKGYTSGIQIYSHGLSGGDGTKKVCVWAKDSAGNVSEISPVNGTLGVDMDTVQFAVGNPPVITNFSAVNNEPGVNFGSKNFAVGDQIKITWSMTDVEELAENPVTLRYTTSSLQNPVWTDIVVNHGSIGTGQTSYNDTYLSFLSPTAGFFRIELVAKDSSGNTSQPAEANILNTGQWSVYAGSAGRGVGGSGTATRLSHSGSRSAAQGAIVNPLTNDAYVIDIGQGIYKMNAVTGKSSMFIKHGVSNFVSNTTLDTTSRINTTHSYLSVDSNGLMYVVTLSPGGGETSKEGGLIWQINLETGLVRKYIGGGTITDGSATPNTAHTMVGPFSIDENNTLYYYASCNVSTNFNRLVDRVKLMKVTQNVSGDASIISHVAGDCVGGALTPGAAATTQPLTATSALIVSLMSVTAWDNGNKIFYCHFNDCKKIINGNIYDSNISSSSTYYHHSTSTLYTSSAAALGSLVLNELGNNGDVLTPFVNNAGTGECLIDGLDRLSGCNIVGYSALRGPNGSVAFMSGATINAPSFYSLKYVADNNKIYTYVGSTPFYGDGLDKELAKGNLSGIYYKKASAPNQVAFPEGLYFTDRSAMVLGQVKSDDSINLLVGNQSGGGIPSHGDLLDTSLSFGFPYIGGHLHGLSFNDQGLPVFRLNATIASIAPDMTLNSFSDGSGAFFDTYSEGADPSDVNAYVFGTYNNVAVKDTDKVFMLGSYFHSVSRPSILSGVAKLFDFGASYTHHIMGDTSVAAATSADDASGGNLGTKTFHSNCYSSARCYMTYDDNSDRLYFSEDTKLRYISTPDNSVTSTLGTVFTATAGVIVYNFIFKEDGSQVFYLDQVGRLRCHDISSGKAWCDESILGPIAGMDGIDRGSNQLTWRDANTLLISNYRGLVYQYELLP